MCAGMLYRYHTGGQVREMCLFLLSWAHCSLGSGFTQVLLRKLIWDELFCSEVVATGYIAALRWGTIYKPWPPSVLCLL